MTALPDLLRALAEREPERFRFQPGLAEVYLRGRAARNGWVDVWAEDSLLEDCLEWRWRLREALEQACEARGWMWSVGRVFYDQLEKPLEPTIAARVLRPDMWIGNLPTISHPNAAHALAAAYLKALEERE